MLKAGTLIVPCGNSLVVKELIITKSSVFFGEALDNQSSASRNKIILKDLNENIYRWFPGKLR
jgi:hypothetical protein